MFLQFLDFGKRIILDSSSDEDEAEPNHLEKVWNFCEETIPRFSDRQFKEHFRISPTTFESLLIRLHSIEDNIPHSGHPQLSLEKQLMITIWYLANIESFRQVSMKFGISKSSCWHILYRICRKLLVVNERYRIIAWPSEQQARENIAEFERISGFPGIIGAIDGCHILIQKPKEFPNSYINRKGYPSILLQGVCDHRKLFIDAFTGVPGSVHDSRLFTMSDLSERINLNRLDFPENSHLVGDLAYPLHEKLMVGFKNIGNLNQFQRNFNKKLNKARVLIEHSFAWLLGRFRRLKMIDAIKLDLIALLIMSACILHNICILEEDLPEDLVNLNDFQIEEENNHHQPDVRAGRNKRNAIMQQLPID